MCGIAGFYHSKNQYALPQMLAAIAHRGPDAKGMYFSENEGVALGHRRLSIIDLSDAANQPFKKHGLVLVFNGEIYNYQELTKELIKLGVYFQTYSDTEVLLEAWYHWGVQCLNKLRGMFAFTLYDEKTKKMYFARDPFGIKPFFYYHEQDRFAFASELKALLPVMNSKQINPLGVSASLLYVWLPDSVCMLDKVHKLPAGHWGEFDGHSLRIHPYYSLEEVFDLNNTHVIDEKELESILLDSVEHHLLADVPVATFLSGGLDSSLITAMAVSMGKKIQSYTIGFRDVDKQFEAMPDDASYARRLAKKLGITLNEIEISPNIADLLPQIVHSLDEPIGDAAAINTYLICKGAREQGIKVLLSGMGADEIFAGYRRHYACKLATDLQRYTPEFLRDLGRKCAHFLPVANEKGGFKSLRWLKRFSQFMNLPEEAAYRQSYTYYLPEDLKNLLDPGYGESVDKLIQSHAEIYWKGPVDQINRMCAADIQLFMLGLNLTYTDRASMAASTEVRVPFVDKEVIRASFSLPGHMKLRGRTGKYMLKKIAERWLPHEIIYRPKAGFSAPLRSWVRRDLRDKVDEDLLGSKGLVSRGFFNRKQVEKMIHLDRIGRMDYSQQIWQMLTLEEWFKQIEK